MPLNRGGRCSSECPECQSPHAAATLQKSFAAKPSRPTSYFSINRRPQNLQPFKCPSKKSLIRLLNRSGFVVKLRALFDGARIESHQTLCRYSSAVVEQLTCNQQVPSSTLGGGTTFFLLASRSSFLCALCAYDTLSAYDTFDTLNSFDLFPVWSLIRFQTQPPWFFAERRPLIYTYCPTLSRVNRLAIRLETWPK